MSPQYASNNMFSCFVFSSTFCGKGPDSLWFVSPPFAVHSLETKYRNYSSVNLFLIKGFDSKYGAAKLIFESPWDVYFSPFGWIMCFAKIMRAI